MNQRAAPRLLTLDLPSVQNALNQAFAYIYQLESVIAQPGLYVQLASDDLTLTITPELVPGAYLSLPPGTYLVLATFGFGLDVAANEAFGYLAINGARLQSPIASVLLGGAGDTILGMGSLVWQIKSDSQIVLNLMANKITNTGTAQLHKENTVLAALRVA